MSTRYMHIYSALNDAMLDAAAQLGVRPADVRLLVLLYERGGSAVGTSHRLAVEMGGNSTAIRRSSVALRRARLITAVCRRGMGSRYQLTRAGTDLAQSVLAAADRTLAWREEAA